MPIYEYGCRKCGHLFEVLIRTPQDTPAACPQCGSARPGKVFSSFAVAAGGKAACDSCPSVDRGCPSRGCGAGGCSLA